MQRALRLKTKKTKNMGLPPVRKIRVPKDIHKSCLQFTCFTSTKTGQEVDLLSFFFICFKGLPPVRIIRVPKDIHEALPQVLSLLALLVQTYKY